MCTGFGHPGLWLPDTERYYSVSQLGVGGWAMLSTHNCSGGGEDPSCPQCTVCQEKGQPMGEAGSRMRVLEIKIMKERRQRTEDWRTKWGKESGASEEIEESGRANSGKPREKKAFQKKLNVVSAGSDGREKSNGVKAEERPVDLSINKSLTVGLAPTSKLLGPWESPDSGRQFRKLFQKFCRGEGNLKPRGRYQKHVRGMLSEPREGRHSPPFFRKITEWVCGRRLGFIFWSQHFLWAAPVDLEFCFSS